MYIVAMEIDDHELYLFVKEPLLLNFTPELLDYMLHWEIKNFGLFFKKKWVKRKE